MCSVRAMDASLIIGSVVVLLAVMNPFLDVPRFLELTSGQSVAQRRRTALSVTLRCALIAVVLLVSNPVVVGGGGIHGMLNLSEAGLLAGGGLVIAIIALAMLRGQQSSIADGTQREKEGYSALKRISGYPLTFPLIMGPGTIVSILCLMLSAERSSGSAGLSAVAVAVIIALLVLGVSLVLAAGRGTRPSEGLTAVMTRLSGLVLMVFGVGMVASVL